MTVHENNNSEVVHYWVVGWLLFETAAMGIICPLVALSRSSTGRIRFQHSVNLWIGTLRKLSSSGCQR